MAKRESMSVIGNLRGWRKGIGGKLTVRVIRAARWLVCVVWAVSRLVSRGVFIAPAPKCTSFDFTNAVGVGVGAATAI